MTDEGIAKVAELIKDAQIAMFTTVDADGRLVSRPMSLQEVEFDGDLWFFASDRSDTVSELGANPAVNVSFSSGSSWVSVTGDGEVVRDRATSERLWNKDVEAWFPDGPDTPGVVLIKVATHGAQYWDVPSGTAVHLFSMVKSKLAGEPYKGGDGGTVEL